MKGTNKIISGYISIGKKKKKLFSFYQWLVMLRGRKGI